MPSRPIYRLDFSRFGLVSPRRKSMFASDSLPRRLVRLLVDVQQRIVQEALDRRSSMNAVVGEAQNKKHAAPIEAAIDMAQLPSAAILTQSSYRQREEKRRLARTSCCSR